MPLTDRLRRATKDALDALEVRSLFEAMVEAMVEEGPPHQLYAAWLRIMAVVLGALEQALDEVDAADDALIRELRSDDRPALSLLAADLVVLDHVPAKATAAIEPMLALVEELRRWGREQPVRLIGALHASQSMVDDAGLHERLAGRRGPGAAGSAHALGPTPSRAAASSRPSALEPSSHAMEQVVDAARSVHARLCEIVRALLAPDEGEHTVTRVLNSDAGHHEITCDPREIMAAIDAGVRTWNEHPYYEVRYGARGRRFTRSDSGWLVMLAELDEGPRLERLDWLAKLLAARGMPTLLLEIHLHHLYEALVAAVPERAARYGGLQAASHTLRSRRLAALPELEALAASLPVHEELGNLGLVLVSAVADERQGIPGAVSSVADWLTDPQRFSAAWSAAVRHTLDLARRS